MSSKERFCRCKNLRVREVLKKNKRNLTREGRERGRASDFWDPLHGSDSVSSCFSGMLPYDVFSYSKTHFHQYLLTIMQFLKRFKSPFLYFPWKRIIPRTLLTLRTYNWRSSCFTFNTRFKIGADLNTTSIWKTRLLLTMQPVSFVTFGFDHF